MRYEMVRLAQLVFALSLMFGAFLGGLTIGWLRWGRRVDDPAPHRRAVPTPEPMVPRVLKHDLFSPEVDGRVVVDLTTGPFSPAELSATRAEDTTVAPS